MHPTLLHGQQHATLFFLVSYHGESCDCERSTCQRPRYYYDLLSGTTRVPKSYEMVDDKAGLSPLIEWANSKEASVDGEQI